MNETTDEQLVENTIGTEYAVIWAILNRHLDNECIDIEEAKKYIINEILELK